MLLGTLVSLACGVLADTGRIVAIEILGSLTPALAVGETLTLRARAVDASGAAVSDAAIMWELIDVDSGQVGFTLEPETGRVTGVAPGSGRVVGRAADVQSGIITITVTDAGGGSP